MLLLLFNWLGNYNNKPKKNNSENVNGIADVEAIPLVISL
jgi:hypothetical protein